ncbi:unnamed protein product [Chondrus crispus]|uniref:DNA replication licensing factor MCM3 n=1 Tax=Chondrus crispus TaxID=2769 RepID=R7Q5D0_CHOCR|nr:unnamed protein product [Chondrus crispus]CDF33234.1 unnamed protein product [Chondrus crispus]|eukprot:XP_005713037.1 unnamed protein product [Chondrus crispus]
MNRGTPIATQQQELMRRFTTFLDADNGHGVLADRIQQMVQAPDQETLASNDTPKRLIVSLDHLRDFDSDLAQDVIEHPVDHLPVFERAMQDLIMGIRQDLSASKRRLADFRIGLDGAFGSRHVSPRGLNAGLVGGVVRVDGIVTRASVVRPRLVLSVHYCPITKKFHEKTFRDNASVSSLAMFTQNAGMPGSSYPTKDEDGNPLETEFGMCWYRDSQRVTIQEMPEKSPPGQLPRSVEVLIESDLCDACKPGDRVSISGIFRAVGGAASTSGSGMFSTFVVANHISLLSGVEGRSSYSQHGHVLSRMSKSIAPSICGHDFIKKAILLFLIGGKERNLANGTHLRGDLNIMMVGDPSTAKSQLLRFIMNTAPLAVSTTGRGSSGVGLTAAVTTDQDTGDRHLEAGAMVLADRGVVCIDEFDKMSDEDRVAIHEVMEQQTVTIAKAGIHASLNARCSVVAAANPVYGSYDKTRPPNENIALPDSLLSRFDLLFIVLDIADKERDRQIADHVLRGHRTDTGSRRRSARQSARQAARSENKILSPKFLRLYISYAKHRVNPVLSREACEHIAQSYQSLRQNMLEKTQHITARCLETLIRLATAHAKLRLDKRHVLREDAVAAAEVLRFALFNQAEPDKSEKEDEIQAAPAARPGSRRRRREASEGTVIQESEEAEGGTQAGTQAGQAAGVVEEDVAKVMEALNALRGRESMIKTEALLEKLRGTLDEGKVLGVLDVLGERDIVVVADGSIFIV